MTSADRIARARSMRSADDAVQLYDSWAADYDHDVFDVMGFTGTNRIADLLAAHLPRRDAPVIDLGCGTGAAGSRLAAHGFSTIDGIDISQAMLDIATRSGVYRHLLVGDLTRPLPITRRYDAAVSAGTFTTGHVGAEAVPGIIALLRPGAVVAWVVADSLWPRFQSNMAAARLQLVHAVLEPVRRDGPAESMMVVARVPDAPQIEQAVAGPGRTTLT